MMVKGGNLTSKRNERYEEAHPYQYARNDIHWEGGPYGECGVVDYDGSGGTGA